MQCNRTIDAPPVDEAFVSQFYGGKATPPGIRNHMANWH